MASYSCSCLHMYFEIHIHVVLIVAGMRVHELSFNYNMKSVTYNSYAVDVTYMHINSYLS